jgi:hypothetical protein
MSHVLNLDVGVKNAMIATLRERGENVNVATTKAQAKLAQAMTYVHGRADAAAEDGSEQAKRDRAYAWRKAFQDLKTWTLKNVP